MKYLALDTETGGLDADKVSLLSIYLGVYNEKFWLVDELELFIKPEDAVYKVTAQALTVNKINLIDHDKKSVDIKKASTLIYDFICRNSDMGANKLVPVGQNVAFDIRHIQQSIISRGSWEKFCSYRLRDVGAIAAFLQDAGLIDKGVKGSLSSFAEYFKLNTDNVHDAKFDAQLGMEVYKKLKELIKK